VTQFKLAACLPFDGQVGPGFHLPIFTSSDQAGQFVQVSNSLGTEIEKFCLFESLAEGIMWIESDLFSDVGCEPIFVFVDNRGKVACGPRSQIAERLRPENLDSAQSLQFAELVGSDAERLRARELAVKAYGDGTISSQFMFASISAQAIWDTLISSSVTVSARNELLVHRRLLMLLSNIETDEIIPDEIWEKISPLISIDRNELRNLLSNVLPKYSILTKIDIDVDENYNNDEKFFGLINTISYISRQEERSAFLLELLIEDPDKAKFILERHTDRGQVARAVWDDVRRSMGHLKSSSHREQFAASMVQRIFSLSHSFTRGETLYYLAKRLGRYPLVAHAIRRKMGDSAAFNVHNWRSAINRILD
jgi:hypothetical protein